MAQPIDSNVDDNFFLSKLQNRVPREYYSFVFPILSPPPNSAPPLNPATDLQARRLFHQLLDKYPACGDIVGTSPDDRLYLASKEKFPEDQIELLEEDLYRWDNLDPDVVLVMASPQQMMGRTCSKGFCPKELEVTETYIPVRLRITASPGLVIFGFSFFRPMFGPNEIYEFLKLFTALYRDPDNALLPESDLDYAIELVPASSPEAEQMRENELETEMRILHDLYAPSLDGAYSSNDPPDQPISHLFSLDESFLGEIINRASQAIPEEGYWGYSAKHLAAVAVLWVSIMRARKAILDDEIFPGEQPRGRARVDISVLVEMDPMTLEDDEDDEDEEDEEAADWKFEGNNNYPVMCTQPASKFLNSQSTPEANRDLLAAALDEVVTKMRHAHEDKEDMMKLADIADLVKHKFEEEAYQSALNSKYEGLFVENWTKTDPELFANIIPGYSQAQMRVPQRDLRHGMIQLLCEPPNVTGVPVGVSLSGNVIANLIEILRNW